MCGASGACYIDIWRKLAKIMYVCVVDLSLQRLCVWLRVLVEQLSVQYQPVEHEECELCKLEGGSAVCEL